MHKKKPPLEFVQLESYVGVMVLLAVLDGVLVTVLDWVLLALVAWDLVWDLVRDVLAVALLTTKEQLKQHKQQILSLSMPIRCGTCNNKHLNKI